MKNIIIFGKNGFISKKLINLLKKNKIKHKSFGKKEIDLTKKTSINLIKKNIENNAIIVFISSIVPVKKISTFNKNLRMLENFLSGIKKKKIKYLIYISSDAVYFDSRKPLSEYSLCRPSSLHGNMQLVRENILRENFKNKIAILRPTLIYGHGDPHNGYGPNRFMRSSLKNRKIEILGNGEEIRDHIHVNDLVNIIFQCIKKEYKGILNLVTGFKISFLTIAKAIIKKNRNNTNIIKKIRSGPIPHNGYRVFNNKKLKLFMKNYKFKRINTKNNFISF